MQVLPIYLINNKEIFHYSVCFTISNGHLYLPMIHIQANWSQKHQREKLPDWKKKSFKVASSCNGLSILSSKWHNKYMELTCRPEGKCNPHDPVFQPCNPWWLLKRNLALQNNNRNNLDLCFPVPLRSKKRKEKGTLFRCASFVLLKVNLRVVWSIFGSIALAHFYHQVIRTEVSVCLWIAFPYVTIIFNETIWITMALVEILIF